MKLLLKLSKVSDKFSWEMLVIIGEYLYDFDLTTIHFAKQNELAKPLTDPEKFNLIEKALIEIIEAS